MSTPPSWRNDPTPDIRRPTRVLEWISLVALALILRVIWWKLGALVIEDEGANYARAGETFAAGRGFLGLDELGAQLIYPPLYPTLIGLGSLLGATSEVAGRAVSLVCGVATPCVFLLVGRHLYGNRAGWAAAVVAAMHPLLIAASVAVLSESLYLFLVLSGIYQVLRLLERSSKRYALGAGACFGLAYLCRPEALFLAFVMALIAVVAAWSRRRQALTASALLLGVVAMCVVPYSVYLRQQTGQWRFEAKTPQGIIYQMREAAGQSTGQIYWGIDENLAGTGISNTSDASQARLPRPPAIERAKMAARQVKANFPKLLRAFTHMQAGGPIFAVFVGLGLFAAAWDRRRLWQHLPLLGLLALIAGPFLLWPMVVDRALFMFFAPLIVFAGAGLVRFHDWIGESAAGMGVTRFLGRAVATSATCVAVAMFFSTSLFGVRETDEMSQSWSARTEYAPIGRWLAAAAPRARIADSGPTVAFYGGAVLVRFPWTNGDTAIQYLARNDVDYVVLREAARSARPYLADWLANPPDAVLTLERKFETSAGAVFVYRWKR